MITKNKVVSVSYELKTEPDGGILETADAGHPLEFICGQGQINSSSSGLRRSE